MIYPKGMKSSSLLRTILLCCLPVFFSISAGMDSGDPPPHRSVFLNKPFEITLKANPTTGYRWEASFDRSLLRLQDRSFKRDEVAAKGRMGAGGKTTFVFVPIKVGKAIINFRYKRPWEAKGIKEVAAIVAVSP